MRKRLFELVDKLEKQELKRTTALAVLVRECAEDGEMWECEILVECFHA